MQRRLPLVSAGDARRHFAGERILAAPPPLFILHQSTAAAEVRTSDPLLRAQVSPARTRRGHYDVAPFRPMVPNL